MTNTNIMRLLGLTAILCMIPFANNAFAATATVTSAKVISPSQVQIVFSDPLDWAIGDFTDLNIAGEPRTVDSISEVSPSSTVTITFSGGSAVQTDATGDIDIAVIADGGSGNDFSGATNQAITDGQAVPVPVLSYSGTDPTNSNPVSFSVNFGEDINPATFTPSDVTASSGTVLNIADSGDGQNFTFDVDTPADGATLSVQITGDVDDLAGNTQSADSNTITVDVDYTAPTTPDTPDLQAASDSNINTDNITNDSTPSFDITGVVSGDTVKLYANGIEVASGVAAGSSITLTSSVILDVVDTPMTATSTDPVGNISAISGSLLVTVDTANPVVTGSVLNINDGGDTLKTAIDQYAESCSATDITPVSPACIIQSGLIDTSVLGLQSVTYEATDTAGNMGTDTVSTTIIPGSLPTISVNPGQDNLPVSQPFYDNGVTATDGDGPVTITVEGGVDVNAYGSYVLKYTATDTSGNSVTATRTVTVNPTSGDWCSGDCIPPTIGIDSSGRRMVDWPVIYHTSTVDFRQLAEYFHTPMNDFTVNVGDINTLQFVVYDNSGFDAIRQIGLSIGVPFSGTFNDGAAQLRWFAAPLGQTVGDNTSYIEETDPDNVFELKSFHTERVECDPHKTGNDNCMGVTIKYIFREAPKDTAVRLDIWDEKRNAFQHVLNEGVTVKGDSMNGPDVFTAMANDGRMYTLTTDNNFATDQNGDRWSLVDGFWAKDLKPVINMLDDAREMAKDQQESIAKQKFDGSKLQKTIAPVKDFIPEHYDRLHDPVPNMIKAYIDYAKKQAGHS